MTPMETLFDKHLDRERFAEYLNFVIKVNERTEWQYGLRDVYNPPDGNPALGATVEYFGSVITQDDRMRYIMENIVSIEDLSPENKIGNTTISHFYGARGIHSTVTGIKDPKKAHVDFVRIAEGDQDYLDEIKKQIAQAKSQKKKFYGTTELHTSLQTAARNYCRVKYGEPNRPASLSDIIEWIAGWVKNGFTDKILNEAHTLKDMFTLLRTQPGIGEYYGYHCATSNSVNPHFKFNHDEAFCVPGPGAKDSVQYLFPNWQGKIPAGDAIIWVRSQFDRLYEGYKIHEFFHNFEVQGKPVFSDPQDTIKCYTAEVSFCQFSVYRHLTANPHLVSKRQIARNEDDSVCDGALNLDELF